MNEYEFEITHTVTLTRTVSVKAKNEEAAEAFVLKKIEEGITGDIEVTAGEDWEVEEETTFDYL